MARQELPNTLPEVAERARYVPSPYHKTKSAPMGTVPKRRWRHASKCDGGWTPITANAALKQAIREGRVSVEWRGDFPRYVWHKHDDVLYEAFLSNEGQGEYHGYPLEDQREWPKGVE